MRTAKFYASLTGPLLGLYLPMPQNLRDEMECGMAMNSSRLQKLWCAIYTLEEVERQIHAHGGRKLPIELAGQLDYNITDIFAMRSIHSALA